MFESIYMSTQRLRSASLYFCALTFFLLSVPAQARQVDGEQLAAQLAERYESIDAMQTRFVQTATSSFMDSDERYSGMLVFTNLAYRITTSNQTIVTDGVTTWVYNSSERQVLVNDYVEDESAFSLTSFLTSFSESYRSTLVGSESLNGVAHQRLDLAPVDDFASFRSVSLWIRSSDMLVTRLVVLDLNDVTMTFELSDLVVNPRLPDDLFSFEVPEGIEVIDLRN